MNTRRKALSIALGIGAAVGLIVPLQAAVADSSPPDPYFNYSVQSPATLVARGAAIDVPVSVTCFPETDAFGIDLNVTERVNGGRLAIGFGFLEELQCDGFPHTVRVRVNAFENAFKNGVALVQANAFACTPLQCNSFSEQAEIRIRKK